jgi:hypothetical protein
MTPPQVWCAIPVYNNAATVKDIPTRARAHLDHVLVIDDGSTDADLEQFFPREGEAPAEPLFQSDARAPSRVWSAAEPRIPSRATLAPSTEITLLRHPTNRGKGAALLTAMQYARDHGAHYLITLDADGQHFPEDIPRFLPHLAPDTILLGHRAQVTGDMPDSSHFGREFSDFWIHTETGYQVLDSQSGFRAYPLPACLDLNIRSLRYGFEVEILTRALWSGLQVSSIPIRVHYPPRAQRISSFHPLRDNTRLTLLHARLIARQLLPIPHKQLQIHRRAAENAEKEADGLAGSSGHSCGTAAPGCFQPKVEISSPSPPVTSLLRNTPLNISLCAAVTTFFSIVLYPWGFIPVLYLAVRLHLSKLTAFLFLILCLPTFIPTLSQRIGHALLHLDSHSQFERFIGAHFIAFPACLAAAAITYTVARKLYRNPTV